MVVVSTGTFDLLHPGHLHHLQEARKLGSRLLVAVYDDPLVRKLKGRTRPVCRMDERLAVLGALRCVDAVTSVTEAGLLMLLSSHLGGVLAKGDASHLLRQERELAELLDMPVKFTGHLGEYSTTRLVTRRLVASAAEAMAETEEDMLQSWRQEAVEKGYLEAGTFKSILQARR